MDEEIWKTIEDYPNYDVSNFGNIRNNKTSKLLKLQKNYSGYLKITLVSSNKKGSKNCIVHRLVAKAFIPNFDNKPTVNHIDKNRMNNIVSNLEWATMSEQNYHSALTSKKERPLIYKPIYRIDLMSGNIIEEYKSIKEAALWVFNNNLTSIKEQNKNNISIVSSKICAVANKKRNNAYSYNWKYTETNMHIDNEIWKEIPLSVFGKPNYWVSTFGRYKNNRGEIKNNPFPSSGYVRISIYKQSFLLHRLVALTFLENPENKEFVNHKDGNKLNNSLDNLEWATCLENNVHKINIGLSNCTKKIIQYDLNMTKLGEFNSIVECSKMLNIDVSTVSNNCRNKTKTTKGGYIFRYATK
jgi:hypothetical protein